MTPTELKDCLSIINWSQRQLARLIKRDERTVRRFVNGALQLPNKQIIWLRKLAEFHAQNPPPVEPKKNMQQSKTASTA
jgi:ribosome-binding protein aMBF1 (putative translation factor)